MKQQKEKTGIKLFIKDNLNHIPVIQKFPKPKSNKPRTAQPAGAIRMDV